MKNYYKITPEGTRDYLFEECTAINKVSRIITDVFRSKGYHEALTPGLEFFDAFTRGSSGIQQEDMYKLSDNKGRLLVLRPDLTVPIARMAATRLQKETRPIRLYYNQTVYRNNPALTGRSNEVRQAGIELIGAGGKRADLEVIVTAVEALQKIVPDFRIELGHAGFFKSLAQQLPVSDIVREEIRLSIESKTIPRSTRFWTAWSRRARLRLSGAFRVCLEERRYCPKPPSCSRVRRHSRRFAI